MTFLKNLTYYLGFTSFLAEAVNHNTVLHTKKHPTPSATRESNANKIIAKRQASDVKKASDGMKQIREEIQTFSDNPRLVTEKHNEMPRKREEIYLDAIKEDGLFMPLVLDKKLCSEQFFFHFMSESKLLHALQKRQNPFEITISPECLRLSNDKLFSKFINDLVDTTKVEAIVIDNPTKQQKQAIDSIKFSKYDFSLKKLFYEEDNSAKPEYFNKYFVGVNVEKSRCLKNVEKNDKASCLYISKRNEILKQTGDLEFIQKVYK